MTTLDLHSAALDAADRQLPGSSIFAPGDLTALIIAAVLLAMPALALDAAGWPLDIVDADARSTLLSVLFGFMLARSQYNELLGLLISGDLRRVLRPADRRAQPAEQSRRRHLQRLFAPVPVACRRQRAAASTRMIWSSRCWSPACSGSSATIWRGISSASIASGGRFCRPR